MRRLSASVLALAAAAALSACATVNEPGWTGSGAEPFDAARADCEAQAAGQSSPNATDDQRRAAFEACMAARGWTRG